MKTLYILRHAKSGWEDLTLPDHDRPLDPRGERAALVVGRYMAQEGFVPDLVLCSTARRARETRDLAANQWGAEPETVFNRDFYLNGETGLLKHLAAVGDAVKSVLVVGHCPDIQNLAVHLASRGHKEMIAEMRNKYPTAAFAVIKLPIEHWRDIGRADGALIRFMTPKGLV